MIGLAFDPIRAFACPFMMVIKVTGAVIGFRAGSAEL